MNAKDKIIAATLMVVAAMANRMMNREKDCCRLSAILWAMKRGVFNQLVRMKVQMYRAFLKNHLSLRYKVVKEPESSGILFSFMYSKIYACADCC
jgi:hypothetical protein